jgi:hypothetical protein
MNERIKELAEQAFHETALYGGKCGDAYFDNRYNEKFAELIVKECAETAYTYASESENYEYYDDIGWDCLPGDLKSHIKEHFGVEE